MISSAFLTLLGLNILHAPGLDGGGVGVSAFLGLTLNP